MTFSRRAFLKLGLLSAAATTSLLVGGWVYMYDIEPGWIEVVRRRLTLPRLAQAFDGYRIAQISDIHMGTGMTPERLAATVALINAEQPDLVAITGDFVTRGSVRPLLAAMVEPLRALRAADGMVAVPGNHDHWTDIAAVRAMLAETGIRDLSNAVMTLRRGSAALHIAGVDDWWERLDRLDVVLAALPDDGAAVLLAHEPDYADLSAACGRFDLQLSGHSHGGQVALPLVGPLVLPAYGEKYPSGLYQVGAMMQYTNRGLGTITPAVRFNCRPEITVLTLAAP